MMTGHRGTKNGCRSMTGQLNDGANSVKIVDPLVAITFLGVPFIFNDGLVIKSLVCVLVGTYHSSAYCCLRYKKQYYPVHNGRASSYLQMEAKAQWDLLIKSLLPQDHVCL